MDSQSKKQLNRICAVDRLLSETHFQKRTLIYNTEEAETL